ncbi:uncharacterized protein LOC126787497 [Argentina anserina]|uniref:uncharacterized protein LOC126787497 n=1 Tax=Argentina anserina TaxID=57926 RepID=UPI0021765AEE|nr:uncharacterized protein LOC126787497 [Potentilla anserina]
MAFKSHCSNKRRVEHVNGPDVEEEDIDKNSDHDVEEAEIDEDSDHDVEEANIEEDNIDHDVDEADFEEDNNDHVVEEVGIEEDNDHVVEEAGIEKNIEVVHSIEPNQLEEENHDTINEKSYIANSREEAPFDMDDPGNWNKIDKNITNFLVERGPKRDNNVVFLKDKSNRSFSSWHYFKQLPNGEKQDRKWLVYSFSSDKIFCFCCKLFAMKHLVGQLAEEGMNDWHNYSDQIKSHEESRYHIAAMKS